MKTPSLTYPTALVLEAIASGHRYGFDIMDATGLASGTVYPALRRLESRGFLSGQWEGDERGGVEGRPSRRYYVLSGDGVELTRAARARYPGLEAALKGAGGLGAEAKA